MSKTKRFQVYSKRDGSDYKIKAGDPHQTYETAREAANIIWWVRKNVVVSIEEVWV